MSIDSYEKRFASLGLRVPRILLPRPSVDLERWAVIACDQFTSDPSYWDGVEAIVGEEPSTLRLTLPELYLSQPKVDERMETILRTMDSYLANGVLRELPEGFILVRRETSSGATRTGLVAAIDLEAYDYSPGSRSLIRATEGTIPERIPPRTGVRRGAPIELPHVLVLYDDPDNRIVGAIARQEQRLERLYDFELMHSSGHLSGYHVREASLLGAIAEGFETLSPPGANGLLFAVGDGNHSLAAAKTVWEEIKQQEGPEALDRHPGRYALVELINIHDQGLLFEPIHRVVFGSGEELYAALDEAPGIDCERVDTMEQVTRAVADQGAGQRAGLAIAEGFSVVTFREPTASLAAGSFQELLDVFLEAHPDSSVDYVHGDEEALELGQRPGNIAIFLPAISKESFFQTIRRDGSFPRKTFSMGEASEKRFYLEGRRIVP